MAALQIGSSPNCTASRRTDKHLVDGARIAVIAFVLGLALGGSNRGVCGQVSGKMRPNPFHASTSRAARQDALRSIPIDKLDARARAKVSSVLSNVSVFRRMPVWVIDCDPDLYLFLVRHPDVVVNIWEVLKISQLQLREVGLERYRVAESVGTLATVEFLYSSHDTHVIYAEGSYEGPLFARPVKGRCLLVLKTGYVQETDGRYYITSRLDTFLNVEHGGAELLTKTFHPLIGKVADTNFVQTVAFLGSLSRTAEVNYRSVQRLAGRLTHVQPDNRLRLAELAAGIAQKSTLYSLGKRSSSPLLAVRTKPKP